MRRLARHLFTLCSATSLLLCGAVRVLWVRSHRWTDSITWTGHRPSRVVQPGERWIGVEWGEGVLSLLIRRPEAGTGTHDGGWLVRSSDDPRGSFTYRRRVLRRSRDRAAWRAGFGGWGFDAYGRDGTFLFGWRNYGVPFWPVALVAALPPAAWLGRRVTRRTRRRPGLCPACGYDLRASPERCPECGTVAAEK